MEIQIKCSSCGKFIPSDEISTEHIVPRANGGDNSPENTVHLCKRCSLLRTAEKFMAASALGPTLVSGWFAAFRKLPKTTGAASAGIALALAATSAIVEPSTNPAERPQPTYTEQMKSLDDTRQSLDRLTEFVDAQRRQMEADQQVLSKLQDDRRALKPLVEADRETVNALLREQEARASANASTERLIGFGLGVLASVIASILCALAALGFRKLARRKGEPVTGDDKA